jgi:hypothetical protein
LSCCPLGPLLVEMTLQRGAPAVYFYHAGANRSTGNTPPIGNPGLKCTRADAILKKIQLKNEF